MKVIKSIKHPFVSGSVPFGRGVELRINKASFASSGHIQDTLHYHKKSTQYFVITEGAIDIEVEGKIIKLHHDELLIIEPMEKYRVLKNYGKTNLVVIGTYNEEGDRVQL